MRWVLLRDRWNRRQTSHRAKQWQRICCEKGLALYLTLQPNGLFVFGFIDVYVQCNYDEQHTVNILAIVVSPSLRHMRPRDICWLFTTWTFECYQPTLCYSKFGRFPTDCLLGKKPIYYFQKCNNFSPLFRNVNFVGWLIGSLSREFHDWWTNIILSQKYLPMIGCFQLPRSH
jgi:hypothetical protein